MPVKRTMGKKTTTSTKKKTETSAEPEKKMLTNSQVVKIQTEVLDSFSRMNDSDIMDILYRAGVGSKFFTCQMCGQVKTNIDFYKTTDIRMRTGVSNICAECATEIANGAGVLDKENGITKASICRALEYLDKPFISDIYEQAIDDEKTATGRKADQSLWTIYINILKMKKKFAGYRWKDSDGVQKSAGYDVMIEDTEVETSAEDVIENQEQYEINRRDTIKFCGYDPFAEYKPESDKPRLYAQIVSFLTDEAKNDGYKLQSIVQITKGLNQAEKLNDQIDALLNDKANLVENQALINKLIDSRKKDLDSVSNLAKENGIALNYNNDKSAGHQTLSGKIKKLTDMGLREAKVNSFYVGEIDGMRQVAALSDEARHKQVGLDESVLAEIKDIKVELVEELTRERDKYREMYRLLLVENKDLKTWLQELGLINEYAVAKEKE